VEPLRGEIERQLPAHDMDSFDNLRGYALSLFFAHLMTQPSAELETRMQALLVEGGQRRAHLLGMAEALAPLGLVDAERVASIRRGSGHADTAEDLVALAQLFYERRAELEGKTPFTSVDIARAHTIGIELLDWLGRRKVGNDGARAPGPYEEARLRAFRLLVRAYDATYAAVAYVRRREGDVDELMPSLFGGRGRRRGVSEPDAPAEPEAPTEPDAPADSQATGTQ
ncbi:MAG: hypothetical protein MUF34_32265, partial [Polyangiaceae bacterium]|nr:hypothetical protein [Polyangiaceae bacterium]